MGETYISIKALMAVIAKYNLKPDKEGNVRVTPTMVAEAKAIDLANGVTGPSPEARENIRRAERGEPSTVERINLDDLDPKKRH
jgi:hypothetical protein